MLCNDKTHVNSPLFAFSFIKLLQKYHVLLYITQYVQKNSVHTVKKVSIYCWGAKNANDVDLSFSICEC